MDLDIAAPMRVFVSHTSDLATYPERRSFVEAAINAVNQAGALPGDMRWFESQDRPAAEVCMERIRSCDIYVGILGHRYGSVLDAFGLSYTEWEFEVAGRLGIPRLVFLLDDEAAVPKRLFDGASGESQSAFRARVSQHIVVARFSTAEELKAQVMQALMRERERRLSAKYSRSNEPDITHVDPSNLISGEVFTGPYSRLREVWLDPALVFDEVEVSRFVGREWVIRSLDTFLRRNDRGYFVVQAAAGLGKTMFAAWLAQSRGWPCHFTRRRKGRFSATALRNLAAQLIARYRLERLLAPGGQLPDAAGEPGWFDQVIRAAALSATSAGERLVIVVDGLDEAEQIEGDLPLGLPAALPKGVYLIVTCRTNTALPALRRPREVLTIHADERDNIADIRRYLTAATSEPRLASALDVAGVGADAFGDQLRQRCSGVWVYLRYVLDELRLGLRTVEDVDRLPADLAMYYAESLIPRSPDDAASRWARTRLPLLATLAVAGEPLSVDVIARFAGFPNGDDVQALCSGALRPFLSETVGDEGNSRYGIYHISLRDFLGGVSSSDTIAAGTWQAEQLRRASREAHTRIANYYLSRFGGLAQSLPTLATAPAIARLDGDYGLRFLVLHLQKAGRIHELHSLLACEFSPTPGIYANVWYRAHEDAGTIGDYLTDLQRVRDIVRQAVDVAGVGTQRTPPWGLELHYTLLLAAVKTLAANVPNRLVAKLVEHRVWPLERGLATVRQVDEPIHRAFGLAALLPHVESGERQTVLAEAAAALVEVGDLDEQGWAWLDLFPGLTPDEAMEYSETAVNALGGIADEAARLRALCILVRYLPRNFAIKQLIDREALTQSRHIVGSIKVLASGMPSERLQELVAIALSIENEYVRGRALAELTPYLDVELLDDVIGAVEAINDAWVRARTFHRLADHLPARYDVMVRQATRAADEIAEPLERLETLLQVLQHDPTARRLKIVEVAKAVAKQLVDQKDQTQARIYLAIVADEHSRPLCIVEALDAADSLPNESDRREAICILAEHLTEDSLWTALSALQALTDEAEFAIGIDSLAPYLSTNQLAVALEAAERLSDAEAKLEAALAIFKHLPESANESLAAAAIRTIGSFAGEAERSRGICLLAPKLTRSQLMVVLEMAATLNDVNSRTSALVAVAKQLPDDGIEKFLRRLAGYDDLERRWILDMIADDIPERLLPDALAATQAVTAELGRALFMTQATRHVPHLISSRDALDVARDVTTSFDRADALTALAAVLPPPDQFAVVEEALTVAESTTLPFWRSQAIIDLLPHLSGSLRARALRSLQNSAYSDHVRRYPSHLLLLAKLLPESEKEEVMMAAKTAARALEDPIGRAFGLAVVSASETGALQAELIREAREILTDAVSEGSTFAQVAIRVLQAMPDQLVNSGLRAVEGLWLQHEVRDLPKLLVEATRLLPNGLIEQSIGLIRGMRLGIREEKAVGSITLQLPEPVRSLVLEMLLSGPSSACRRAILTMACSMWHGRLDAPRRAILRRCLESSTLDTTLCALAAAAPLLYREQGSESIEEVLKTVASIQRWWPRTVAVAVDDESNA